MKRHPGLIEIEGITFCIEIDRNLIIEMYNSLNQMSLDCLRQRPDRGVDVIYMMDNSGRPSLVDANIDGVEKLLEAGIAKKLSLHPLNYIDPQGYAILSGLDESHWRRPEISIGNFKFYVDRYGMVFRQVDDPTNIILFTQMKGDRESPCVAFNLATGKAVRGFEVGQKLPADCTWYPLPPVRLLMDFNEELNKSRSHGRPR